MDTPVGIDDLHIVQGAPGRENQADQNDRQNNAKDKWTVAEYALQIIIPDCFVSSEVLGYLSASIVPSTRLSSKSTIVLTMK